MCVWGGGGGYDTHDDVDWRAEVFVLDVLVQERPHPCVVCDEPHVSHHHPARKRQAVWPGSAAHMWVARGHGCVAVAVAVAGLIVAASLIVAAVFRLHPFVLCIILCLGELCPRGVGVDAGEEHDGGTYHSPRCLLPVRNLPSQSPAQAARVAKQRSVSCQFHRSPATCWIVWPNTSAALAVTETKRPVDSSRHKAAALGPRLLHITCAVLCCAVLSCAVPRWRRVKNQEGRTVPPEL